MDPAETLRKVDAILNDTDPNKTEEVETEETKPKKSSTVGQPPWWLM